MEKFLVFHTRYKDIQLGYFEDESLIEVYTIENIKVSKQLLLTVDMIFQKFNTSLNDLSFLAAHLGPAPYTTLRVVLATLNGINFSLGTPLIGVNGLEAFLKHLDNNYTNVVLLNAFANDLYYGISGTNPHIYSLGSKNAEVLLNEISCSILGKINFYGNGSKMYKDKIHEIFGSRAIVEQTLPNGYDAEIVPIQFLGVEALKKWHNKEIEQELFPVYLK